MIPRQPRLLDALQDLSIRGSRWGHNLGFRASGEAGGDDEFLEALVELHTESLFSGGGEGFGVDDGIVGGVGGGEANGALEITARMSGVKVT